MRTGVPPKENYPNISDSFSFYGCSDIFDFSPPMLSKSERQENGILSPAVSQALRHTGKEKELRTNCCSFFYYFFTRAAHRKSHRLTLPRIETAYNLIAAISLGNEIRAGFLLYLIYVFAPFTKIKTSESRRKSGSDIFYLTCRNISILSPP